MKRLFLLTGCFVPIAGVCCTTCNPQLQQKIRDSTFMPNLLSMFSAFIILSGIVALLAQASTKKHRRILRLYPQTIYSDPVPVTTAAIILGIGLGGFIDGIFLHQILQWHQMLSHKLVPDNLLNKSVNMFWDGIFHLFTLVVVIVGVLLLWRLSGLTNKSRSGQLFGGGLLMGWGIFNVVEGTINHHILKLHNVREVTPHPEYWNLGVLILSVLMIAVGWLIMWMRKSKNA